MNRAVAIVAGLGLLAAAYGVAATTPAEELVEAPFGTRGAVGEAISASHLIVTVHAVELAGEVVLGFWSGTTWGLCFVAEATIEATVEATVVEADIFVDGVRYPVTRRGDGDTVDTSSAEVLFPTTGPLLFELPADVVEFPGARTAVLQISTFGDDRLDSVIEIVVDLTTLDIVDRAALEPTRAGTR
jgi:hypothetical protein